MRHFSKCCFAIGAIAAVGLVSCGGDDEKDTELKDSTLSVQESKKYVEQVANEFVNHFNPDDQKAAIDLIDYLGNAYGEVSGPWDGSDYPVNSMRKVAGALRARDYFRAASASAPDVVKFDEYTGIYTVQDGAWVRTGSSADAIVFKIKDASGRDGSLSLSRDGNAESAVSDPFDESATVVNVPKKLTAKLECGGTTYFTTTVTSDINIKGYTHAATLDSKFANVEVGMKMNADNSKAHVDGELKVSGKTIVTVSGNINGADMCDYNKLQLIEKPGDLDRFFHSSAAEAHVLGKIAVSCTAKKFSSLAECDMDEYYNEYYGQKKAEAIAAANTTMKYLRENIDVKLIVDGKRLCNIDWATRSDDNSYDGNRYGYVYVEPVLRFPDGTTYEMGDYFDENSFTSVVNNLDFVIRSYQRLFN